MNYEFWVTQRFTEVDGDSRRMDSRLCGNY